MEGMLESIWVEDDAQGQEKGVEKGKAGRGGGGGLRDARHRGRRRGGRVVADPKLEQEVGGNRFTDLGFLEKGNGRE